MPKVGQAIVGGGATPALAIALGAAIWGLYWVPMRSLSDLGIGAGWSAVLINLPALVLAAVVVLPGRRWVAVLRREVWIAGLGFGTGFAFYAVSLVETNVVRATLLFYLTPVWGTLLAMVLLGEQPTSRRWLALGAAGAGLVLTLGPAGLFEGGFGIGEVLGFLSGLSWAVGTVTMRRARGLPVPALGLLQYGSTVGVTLILAIVLGESMPEVASIRQAASVMVVFYAILVLGSFYVIYWAMAHMSPGRSGLLMMTEVVVAVISAALLLPDEALSSVEWIGAALILLAAAIDLTIREHA